MGYAARVDRNQAEIVMALRRAGASVQPLHLVGKGCPDILVGYRGRCYVFEIKDGAKAPSSRRLTDEEFRWHQQWRGQVGIVESADQAIDMLLQLAGLAA